MRLWIGRRGPAPAGLWPVWTAALASLALLPASPGHSRSRTAIAEVVVSPAGVPVGRSAVGTVRFDGPVMQATRVALGVAPPAVATIPEAVTLRPGAATAAFVVGTTAVGCATISATSGGVTRTARLSVHSTSPVVSLTTDRESWTGVPVTFTATVRIVRPAGVPPAPGGDSVALTNDNPSVATIPGEVFIGRAATSATFAIRVRTYGCAIIGASYGGETSKRALMIYPDFG